MRRSEQSNFLETDSLSSFGSYADLLGTDDKIIGNPSLLKYLLSYRDRMRFKSLLKELVAQRASAPHPDALEMDLLALQKKIN